MFLVWELWCLFILQLSNWGPSWTSLKFQKHLWWSHPDFWTNHCHKHSDLKHSIATQEKKHQRLYVWSAASRTFYPLQPDWQGALPGLQNLVLPVRSRKMVAMTPQTIFLRLRSARISNRCGSANKKPPWEHARRRLRQCSSIRTWLEAIQSQPSNNGLYMYFLACLAAQPRAT